MNAWRRRSQRDVEVQARYAGYIERAEQEIERARHEENTRLPADLDYAALAGLSTEVRQTAHGVASRNAGPGGADARRDAGGGCDARGASAPPRSVRRLSPALTPAIPNSAKIAR